MSNKFDGSVSTGMKSRVTGAALLLILALGVNAAWSAGLLPPAGWTGDFGNEIRTGAGNEPTAIAVAKLAGNANADMVVTDAVDNEIFVYFGNGDGTFQPPATYSVGGSFFPIAVAIGDLNGDGIPDIVVANYNISNITGGNTVSVFLGNSGGTFQAAKTYPVGAEATSLGLANFDGHLDIVTADQGDNTVSFLSGNGDGTFKPRVTFAVSTAPHALAVGDFNGDGSLDLAVVSCPSQLRADPSAVVSCQAREP